MPKLYFFRVVVILTRSREIRSLAKTRNNTERREMGQEQGETRVAV